MIEARNTKVDWKLAPRNLNFEQTKWFIKGFCLPIVKLKQASYIIGLKRLDVKIYEGRLVYNSSKGRVLVHTYLETNCV